MTQTSISSKCAFIVGHGCSYHDLFEGWVGWPEAFLMAKMMSNFPKVRRDLVSRYIRNSVTWNSKQPVFYGCFNGKIPNHYIKNGCFTKHPFKTGCLEFQVHISLAMLEPFVEGVSTAATKIGCRWKEGGNNIGEHRWILMDSPDGNFPKMHRETPRDYFCEVPIMTSWLASDNLLYRNKMEATFWHYMFIKNSHFPAMRVFFVAGMLNVKRNPASCPVPWFLC